MDKEAFLQLMLKMQENQRLLNEKMRELHEVMAEYYKERDDTISAQKEADTISKTSSTSQPTNKSKPKRKTIKQQKTEKILQNRTLFTEKLKVSDELLIFLKEHSTGDKEIYNYYDISNIFNFYIQSKNLWCEDSKRRGTFEPDDKIQPFLKPREIVLKKSKKIKTFYSIFHLFRHLCEHLIIQD